MRLEEVRSFLFTLTFFNPEFKVIDDIKIILKMKF